MYVSGACLTNLYLIGINFNIRGYGKANNQKSQTLYMQLISMMAEKMKNKHKIQHRQDNAKI
jgi:hypothetical protein